MLHLTVKTLLRTRQVVLHENSNLLEAERLMNRHRVDQLPVVYDDALVGIVTRGDLEAIDLSTLASQQGRPVLELRAALPVASVMRRDFHVVSSETDAIEAGRLMLQEHLSWLPVIAEDNEVLGVVTLADFARLGLSALETLQQSQGQVQLHLETVRLVPRTFT